MEYSSTIKQEKLLAYLLFFLLFEMMYHSVFLQAMVFNTK